MLSTKVEAVNHKDPTDRAKSLKWQSLKPLMIFCTTCCKSDPELRLRDNAGKFGHSKLIYCHENSTALVNSRLIWKHGKGDASRTKSIFHFDESQSSSVPPKLSHVAKTAARTSDDGTLLSKHSWRGHSLCFLEDEVAGHAPGTLAMSNGHQGSCNAMSWTPTMFHGTRVVGSRAPHCDFQVLTTRDTKVG